MSTASSPAPPCTHGLCLALQAIPARHVALAGAAAGAGRLGGENRRLDHRGRLRQRVPLCWSAATIALCARSRAARALSRHLQQDPVSRPAARLRHRARATGGGLRLGAHCGRALFADPRTGAGRPLHAGRAFRQPCPQDAQALCPAPGASADARRRPARRLHDRAADRPRHGDRRSPRSRPQRPHLGQGGGAGGAGDHAALGIGAAPGHGCGRLYNPRLQPVRARQINEGVERLRKVPLELTGANAPTSGHEGDGRNSPTVSGELT